MLIFYNGLAGVLAAVLRGLLSIAFGLVLFIRLDRNILMKGFEIFDKGKKKSAQPSCSTINIKRENILTQRLSSPVPSYFAWIH